MIGVDDPWVSLSGVEAQRAMQVLVVGGRRGRVGEALVGALSHDRTVARAELISEAPEAAIWARFGSADLVVVFPDAAPLPKGLVSDLESHGCKLVGVYESDDLPGEALLEQSAVLTRVALGGDLSSSCRMLLQAASDRSEPSSGPISTQKSRSRPNANTSAPSTGVVGVASLGHSAGTTTVSIALAGALAHAGYSVALADLDFRNRGLSRWFRDRHKRGLAAGGVGGSDPEARLEGAFWRTVSVGGSELLVCVSCRSGIDSVEGGCSAVDLSSSTPLHSWDLGRRVEAVILDAGTIASGLDLPVSLDAVGGIARRVGADTPGGRGWILVCRGDPGGVKAFIESWASVCNALGDPRDAVVALNSVPSGVSRGKLRAQSDALLAATGCRAVLYLPHDPELRSLFWSRRFPPEELGGADFATAVRSLAASAGFELHRQVSGDTRPSPGHVGKLAAATRSVLRRWRHA